MIKKITLLSAFAVASFIAIDSQLNVAVSDSNGKSGYAGDPAGGSKTCARSGCHSDFGTTAFTAPASTISFKDAGGNEVYYYTGGATYTVTINAMNHIAKAGFNCIIEDNSAAKMGTFASGTGSQLLNGYVSHTGAGNSGSNKSWSFTWVAPAAGSGSLTLYASVNRADNSFTSSGDSIFVATRILTDGANGIADIHSANNLIIAPNPATSFITIQSADLSATNNVAIYALNGELMISQILNLKNQSIAIDNLNKGIYLVQVSNDKGTFVKKFVKE
ncbi:MAG: hypothetical protein RJA07_2411 [Bacteroidota bacterium]|jgi:hypothetical protein